MAFIRPHKNVIDYELLPYHRFGESKYGFLGGVRNEGLYITNGRQHFKRLKAIIDEAFGRGGAPT